MARTVERKINTAIVSIAAILVAAPLSAACGGELEDDAVGSEPSEEDLAEDESSFSAIERSRLLTKLNGSAVNGAVKLDVCVRLVGFGNGVLGLDVGQNVQRAIYDGMNDWNDQLEGIQGTAPWRVGRIVPVFSYDPACAAKPVQERIVVTVRKGLKRSYASLGKQSITMKMPCSASVVDPECTPRVRYLFTHEFGHLLGMHDIYINRPAEQPHAAMQGGPLRYDDCVGVRTLWRRTNSPSYDCPAGYGPVAEQVSGDNYCVPTTGGAGLSSWYAGICNAPLNARDDVSACVHRLGRCGD